RPRNLPSSGRWLPGGGRWSVPKSCSVRYGANSTSRAATTRSWSTFATCGANWGIRPKIPSTSRPFGEWVTKLKDNFRRRLMFRLIGTTLVQVVALLSLWGGLYILIGSTSVGNVVVRLLLRMLGDNYFTVLPGLVTAYMLIPVAGVAFLVYRPVAKATEYLDQLVNSVDTLLQDDDTLIQLPADLQSVEVQLNGLK